MKFLKLANRYRQSKSSCLTNEQENLPISTYETKIKHNIPQQVSIMEDQAMELCKKEDHQYLEQIISYLANLQEVSYVHPEYFRNQPDITQHMRSVLLNWLVDVHLKYKLQPKTLFIIVHIIDQYLSRIVVKRIHLQLVGISALWIASKYQQTYQVPKISNLVSLCDYTYTKQQILEMQTHIIQVIDFKLLFNTELHYFEAINQISRFQPKDFFLSRYILLQFKKYHPKVIACSTAYFIRKLRKQTNCWSEKEKQLFNIPENDLKQCARQICLFWKGSEGVQIFSSLKAKFQSSNYKEVSKIKIGQPNKTVVTHLRA